LIAGKKRREQGAAGGVLSEDDSRPPNPRPKRKNRTGGAIASGKASGATLTREVWAGPGLNAYELNRLDWKSFKNRNSGQRQVLEHAKKNFGFGPTQSRFKLEIFQRSLNIVHIQSAEVSALPPSF
jgi:hypothetical protein